ncbi:hypothetical protein BRARA_H01360 [Brassica rapa]|uniref:Uncharacterized protein n=1 Tax=Brassica campestris TaxID=3711 RepID=A0A397YBG1_BRACM|nr:hypothetical protein BRARA_H01360 [Brassica rapa]
MSSSGSTKPRWTIACVGISSFRALGSNSASLLRCPRIRSTVTRDCKAATWKNSDVPLREMVLHLQHSETPPLLAPASLRNGLCCY